MEQDTQHGCKPDMDDNDTQASGPTCSDLVIEYLVQLGVSRIFGVPGGAIEPFFDAVSRAEKQQRPIDIVVSRHESGAAFMADGYYREAGGLGVCCSTTGPGATNMLTGVSSAREDNIPMLVITAQTARNKFGNKALQDSSCAAVDVVSMYRACTKYSTLVSHPEQLETKLIQALNTALTPPMGPVHLSIPADILGMPLDDEPVAKTSLFQQTFSFVTENAAEQLAQAVGAAQRVLIFVGEQSNVENNQLLELAEMLDAAIVSDPAGRHRIDETHPRYYGAFGFSGHTRARNLVLEQQYDLVLALGTQVGELGTSGWESKLLSERMVHIDSSNEPFARTPSAKLHICGPMPEIIQQLCADVTIMRIKGQRWQNPAKLSNLGPLLNEDEQRKAYSNSTPLKPQRLFSTLATTLPDNTRIFLDAGNTWTWAIHYMPRKNSQGHTRIAMGYGSMTWAIGASVGSAVTNPTAPHVCITGDGSYLMAGQEITVAIQHQLPLVMMILNDDALGMVKHGQRLGKAEQIGFELPHISYAGMAEAMGIEGIIIESPEQLDEINFQRLFNKQAPTIIDLRIDPEEVPPMGERIKGLTTNR